jgi:hypothetical protein
MVRVVKIVRFVIICRWNVTGKNEAREVQHSGQLEENIAFDDLRP